MSNQSYSLADLKQKYDEDGYVVFETGVTDIWILDLLAEHFGIVRGGVFWNRNFEVKFEPGSELIKESVSHSATEFLLHTDGSFEQAPPRGFFLQCVQSDNQGFGVSLIVDVWEVIKRLSENARKILLETPFTFKRVENGVEARVDTPILAINENVYTIRYRNDRKNKLIPSSQQAAEALAEFEQIAALPEIQKSFFLTPGSILFANNYRMLHGRTALSGTRLRLLRRLWID